MPQKYTLQSGATEVVRRVAATREPGGDPTTRQALGQLRVKTAAGRVHVHDQTRVRVAWFDLPNPHDRPGVALRPVMVMDEERRTDITDAIADALKRDHPALADQVRRSSQFDARPYMPVQMGYTNTLKLWYVQVGANTVGIAETRLGLYDHNERTVIVPTVGLQELIVNCVRRTGLTVDSYRIVTLKQFERMGWIGELNFAPQSWFAAPLPAALDACEEEAKSATRAENKTTLPGTHLTTSALTQVPAPVTRLLSTGHGQHHTRDRPRPGRNSKIWSRAKCMKLIGSLGDIDLPASAEQAWNRWYRVSPWHAHLLTARDLMETEADWWNTLSTYSVTCTPLQGTGSLSPANYVNDPLPVDLRAMDDGERARTGHGTLLALFERWDYSNGIRLEAFPKRDSAAGAVVTTAVLRDFGAPPPPVEKVCRLCVCTYSVGDFTCFQIERIGSVDYCPGCCDDTHGTVDEFAYDRTGIRIVELGVTAALNRMHERLRTLPTRRALGADLPAELEPFERDEQVLLRISLPMPASFSVPLGQQRPRTFTDWLRLAGLIDGVRTGRGVASTAADGHVTRSIFEREIDDWMHTHDVAHELEPPYPYDVELNAHGMRADWLLGGTVFVEAAGLLGQAGYDQKITAKRRLAQRHGITLIVVTMSDLDHLEQLLGRYSAGRR